MAFGLFLRTYLTASAADLSEDFWAISRQGLAGSDGSGAGLDPGRRFRRFWAAILSWVCGSYSFVNCNLNRGALSALYLGGFGKGIKENLEQFLFGRGRGGRK